MVHALKIAAIKTHNADNAWAGTDGSAKLTPADDGYQTFRVHVDADYMNKHHPHVGGYYVVDADGCKSFLSALAFKEGYSAEIPATEDIEEASGA
jgi:hypothetical protein